MKLRSRSCGVLLFALLGACQQLDDTDATQTLLKTSPPPMPPPRDLASVETPATGQHRRPFVATLSIQHTPLPPDATRGGESPPTTFKIPKFQKPLYSPHSNVTEEIYV